MGTATYTIAPQNGNGPAVAIVLTTDDQTRQMEAESGVQFSTVSVGSNTVVVDESQVYQPIEGFGAAFTDSAAHLLHAVAPSAARDAAMTDLFTRNGIGLSFMRNPMGASDLARTVYSYDDNLGQPPDLTLANFSVAHDQVDIIPLIQQARTLNPQLKLMANPWSPPGWMKTSGSMIGGSLLSDAPTRTAFAQYFVKYLQAYAAAGILTDYISLQNEPLYDTSMNPAPYPGMIMDAPTQTILLRDYVLPAFAANSFKTKALVYDHNWNRPDCPDTVLSDPAIVASSQVAGIAWHGYAGTPGAMTTLNNKYPGKGNYQTEHTGLTTTPDQTKADFEEITQVMRNWGRTYVKWSLALDENHGPHTGGCGTCTPIVMVNSSTGAVTKTAEYYTLGHFSKFVLSGASRIYSSNASGIVSAAFVNPDASKVLVAYNDTNAAETFEVQWGTQSFTHTLPALGGATFSWSGTQNLSYTVNAKTQIQASSFNSTSGLQTESTTDVNGGYDVGFSSDSAFAVYKNVDFGTAGVSGVSARLACNQNAGGNCGGAIELHLDSATGLLAGSVTIPATGGWQTWITATGNAPSGVTGVHDVYVVFKAPLSGTVSLGNVNWFQFN